MPRRCLPRGQRTCGSLRKEFEQEVKSKVLSLKVHSIVLLVVILVIAGRCENSRVFAQAVAATQERASGRVVAERRPVAPQVVTVLHRLNGIKVLRLLLLRSGQQVGAVTRLDDAFALKSQVHTNVIAGLVLDDGQTIAAWLPEAEVEVEGGQRPFAPISRPQLPLFPGGLTAAPPAPSMPAIGPDALEAPDLTVIAGDGKRRMARYIGLDGITGLSVLRLDEVSPAPTGDAKEILKGQHVRLYAPEPVPQTEASTGGANTIYVRVGTTEGEVTDIAHAFMETISRVKVRSTRLSPADIGGIAVNDAGETVGIVDAVEGGEASLLPTAAIRSAAKRVLARQSSVPRPWLGVRGEPVYAAALEQIVKRGWKPPKAMTLIEERRGILLTSVAPGSPADLADLHPGDVILRVNDEEIKEAEDLSLLLDQAGGGNAVRFTVARPDRVSPELIAVKLSESLDPMFAERVFETHPAEIFTPQIGRYGLETIALRPRVAVRLGANTGLLVVYVQPGSVAFKGGLRSGDVIEAVNGQPVSSVRQSFELLNGSGPHKLNVIRNRQKLVLSVVATAK